jgi:hypothetical protein
VTGGDAYDRADAAVEAMRRLWLDVTQLLAGAGTGDDEQAAGFHAWLAGLPMPEVGSAGRPLHALGTSLTIGGERATWYALGAPSAMIEPTTAFCRSIESEPAELDRLAQLGPGVEPDLLGSWFETRGERINGGWSMVGGLDPAATLDVVDDPAQRESILTALAEREATSLTSIGRAVGAGAATARLVLRMGPASDDESLAALTVLLARLEAPQIPDDVLGAVLAGAGERIVSLSLWTLDDGLARVGLRVDDPPTSLLVALAHAAGRTAELDRAAALLGAIGLDHPTSVEWFLSADGADVEVTADLPAAFAGA